MKRRWHYQKLDNFNPQVSVHLTDEQAIETLIALLAEGWSASAPTPEAILLVGPDRTSLAIIEVDPSP